MEVQQLIIENLNLNESCGSIAQEVFHKAVSPVVDILEKKGRESVKEFTFCTMWLAMGLYVNNLSTSDAEKALNHATTNVIEQLRKMRGEA